LGLRLQMMRVTPCRLTTLQCSQIGFTLERTFTRLSGAGYGLADEYSPERKVMQGGGLRGGGLRSWTPEESQVESCEHQDNANIHCQPFPESVSEEHEIYTDYDGCHRHHVKHDNYLSAHFSLILPN
jgi:hypothetical protein